MGLSAGLTVALGLGVANQNDQSWFPHGEAAVSSLLGAADGPADGTWGQHETALRARRGRGAGDIWMALRHEVCGAARPTVATRTGPKGRTRGGKRPGWLAGEMQRAGRLARAGTQAWALGVGGIGCSSKQASKSGRAFGAEKCCLCRRWASGHWSCIAYRYYFGLYLAGRSLGAQPSQGAKIGQAPEERGRRMHSHQPFIAVTGKWGFAHWTNAQGFTSTGPRGAAPLHF